MNAQNIETQYLLRMSMEIRKMQIKLLRYFLLEIKSFTVLRMSCHRITIILIIIRIIFLKIEKENKM